MEQIADSHDSSTTDTADTTIEAHEAVEQSLRDLLSLGRLWASYGLNVGKHALENSARSQSIAAKLLGDLAVQLKPQEPAAVPEATER